MRLNVRLCLLSNLPDLRVTLATSLPWQGGNVVGKVVGANAPEISAKAMALNNQGGSVVPVAVPPAQQAAVSKAVPLNERLAQLTNKEPVMLFMKGAPGEERCGFSRTIVSLLQEQGVKFGSFDILGDEEVRQGLKEFSKWPTYPQLYAKGKLVGGLDVVKELIEAGELKDELGV